VSEIEQLFQENEGQVLLFDEILANIDEKRSTIIGILSSNPRIFHRVSKTKWKLIPDEQADLETLCSEFGVDRTKIDSFIDDSGELRYSWVRVQRAEDGFSKREVHYLFHTMRKCGALD